MVPYIGISRENLLHNVAEFQRFISPKKKIIAVVKANAYGVGLSEVVSVVDLVVDAYGVDDFDELVELRELTQRDIYVLGYVSPEFLGEAVELGCVLPVFSEEDVEALGRLGKPVHINIKVDAHLGRQGVLLENLESLIKRCGEYSNIRIRGIYSHFSDIEDNDELTHAHTQLDELNTACQMLDRAGVTHYEKHISSTSGIMAFEGSKNNHTHVRLGIGLYGLWPSESLKSQLQGDITLKPVISWVAPISQVKKVPIGYPIGYGRTYITEKETLIGVIPQGYSDGYDRKLSNCGEVLIDGERCPVIGRVAMNMFVVALPRTPGVRKAVLIGRQGQNEITAEELAEKVGTINYEIIARLSPKIKRVVE